MKNIFIEFVEIDQDQPEDKVRIMTMHQAKGLDAKNVIIIGAEEELIPGKDSGKKLYDGLRLLYVSVTRAKDHIYITHCKYRDAPQCFSGTGKKGAIRRLSRFISGGPFKSERGKEFIDSMIST